MCLRGNHNFVSLHSSVTRLIPWVLLGYVRALSGSLQMCTTLCAVFVWNAHAAPPGIGFRKNSHNHGAHHNPYAPWEQTNAVKNP